MSLQTQGAREHCDCLQSWLFEHVWNRSSGSLEAGIAGRDKRVTNRTDVLQSDPNAMKADERNLTSTLRALNGAGRPALSYLNATKILNPEHSDELIK